MNARLKSAGTKLARFAVWWSAMKFAFFLGAISMALYMGALIYAVNHYGADAVRGVVREIAGRVR